MANLPFFSLPPTITPLSGAGSKPSNPLAPVNNQGAGATTPASASSTDSDGESSSLSFYQALNKQMEAPVLPIGQELAAYVQDDAQPMEGGLSDVLEVQTAQLPANALEDIDEAQAVIAPWAQSSIDLQDIQKQRDAQVQVLASKAQSGPANQEKSQLNWQGAQVEGDSLEEQVTQLMDAKGNKLLQPLATAESPSQTQAEAAVLPFAKQVNSENKMTNLDGPSGLGETDSLLEGELELASIHEKPITLTPKTANPSSQTQILPLQPNAAAQVSQLSQVEPPSALPQTNQAMNELESSTDQIQAQKLKMNESLQTAQARLKLDMPPNAVQWNQQISKRVAIMNSEGLQTARIQLDPPELGALEIKIKVQNDQVNVGFTSNHAVVRDALESQAPRLREMMEQEGINLADVNVSEQGQQQGSGGADAEGQFNEDGSPNLDTDAEMEKSSETVSESESLVDYFA